MQPMNHSRRVSFSIALWAAVFALCTCLVGFAGEPIRLFDGKSFDGWNGETNKTWRLVDGVIVGGSLEETVPQNEFLATNQSFTNFVLRLEFKLVGTEGFVNSGVQIRSQRVPNHHEMVGYQADMGDGWWGCIYDETRRNVVLSKPDPDAVEKAVKKQDWNEYEIRAEGRRLVLKINDVLMVDYTEPDESIPQWGVIGLQIHGGGKGLVHFRNITLEPL